MSEFSQLINGIKDLTGTLMQIHSKMILQSKYDHIKMIDNRHSNLRRITKRLIYPKAKGSQIEVKILNYYEPNIF